MTLQEAAASDSDEEDDFIYNPLKLPLGWDGKPIPYWLYKLHGLNQEFECEICGGITYWGRRAFERHFREYRHQASMRVLGIPNTKNFYEITKVADAQKLWKNIQVSKSSGAWCRYKARSCLAVLLSVANIVISYCVPSQVTRWYKNRIKKLQLALLLDGRGAAVSGLSFVCISVARCWSQ